MQLMQFSIFVKAPQNFCIDAMISMSKMITDIGDLPPFYVGLGLPELFWNVAGCFAQNLKKSFKGGLERAIRLNVRKTLTAQKLVDLGDGVDDVAQPES